MRRLLGLLLFAISLSASGVEIGNMRTWAAPDNTRIVFDLSGPIRYRLFQMPEARCVVLDVRGARLSKPLSGRLASDRLVSRVRSAEGGSRGLRLVLDLQRAAEVKGFVLPPSRQYGYRLVLDLFGKPERPAPAHPAKPVNVPAREARDVIVAIDAGHGGEDSGATGPSGVREKDVVLSVARRLAGLVNHVAGMRAVLIRDGDYYIGLRQRIKKARDHQADLFVSIHADAVHHARARGSSVYVLSRQGASSEAARWLAEQENAADLIGGVELDEKDEQLRAVLLDLSQAGAIDASVAVASRVLEHLDRLGEVHYSEVQRAGFVVLKSPDIPSMLVETAYITNPLEEHKLVDPLHQQALAAAILEGIRAYFSEWPPPGTLMARRKGLIGQAETRGLQASALR